VSDCGAEIAPLAFIIQCLIGGLQIRWPKGREGSIPSPGTNDCKAFRDLPFSGSAPQNIGALCNSAANHGSIRSEAFG
jgi:hypothetical protein